MIYARLNPDTGAAEARDFSAPPPDKGWLPLIIDEQPVPTQTQVLVASLVIGEEAHQTWGLRDKTEDEIEAEAIRAEKSQIAGYIADIQAQLDITNSARGAMTTSQRLNTLENDTRALLRFCKLAARHLKRTL
jgi:hypothetical protein